MTNEERAEQMISQLSLLCSFNLENEVSEYIIGQLDKAVQQERERCAKIVESRVKLLNTDCCNKLCQLMAKEIRN